MKDSNLSARIALIRLFEFCSENDCLFLDGKPAYVDRDLLSVEEKEALKGVNDEN